jgi:hypothetical protein
MMQHTLYQHRQYPDQLCFWLFFEAIASNLVVLALEKTSGLAIKVLTCLSGFSKPDRAGA